MGKIDKWWPINIWMHFATYNTWLCTQSLQNKLVTYRRTIKQSKKYKSIITFGRNHNHNHNSSSSIMERREQKRPFIKLNNSTHIIFTWCCVYCVAMPCRPTYNDNGKKPQKVARAKVRFSGALTKYMSVEVYAIGMYLCIFNWPLNTKWQTHASNLSEKRSIVW